MPERTCSIDGCDLPHTARGWCKTHYARWRRYGDPTFKPAARPRPRRDRSERFWSKVDKSGGPDACWPWTDTPNRDGYGTFYWGVGQKLAHRVAWFLTYGEWPTNQLDHTCHNGTDCNLSDRCPHRRCVNPAHLENVLGRVNILRGESPAATNAAKTHCLHGHPFAGENLGWRPDGRRQCRSCSRAESRRRRKGTARG